MTDVLKEKMNKALIEIQENTNKQQEEINKSCKENKSKTKKQLKETSKISRPDNGIRSNKKTQTEKIMEMKNFKYVKRFYRSKLHQQNTRDKREYLRNSLYERINGYIGKRKC